MGQHVLSHIADGTVNCYSLSEKQMGHECIKYVNWTASLKHTLPFDLAITLLRLYSIKVKDLEYLWGCLVKHYLKTKNWKRSKCLLIEGLNKRPHLKTKKQVYNHLFTQNSVWVHICIKKFLFMFKDK